PSLAGSCGSLPLEEVLLLGCRVEREVSAGRRLQLLCRDRGTSDGRSMHDRSADVLSVSDQSIDVADEGVVAEGDFSFLAERFPNGFHRPAIGERLANVVADGEEGSSVPPAL